jgi:hypothetical protein
LVRFNGKVPVCFAGTFLNVISKSAYMRRFITLAKRRDPKEGPPEEPVVEFDNPDEGKISDVDDGGESAAAGSLED